MSATFLDAWASALPHVVLVRIKPDGPARGRCFRWPAERDAALAWITEANAADNVYFSVNHTAPLHKKPKKSDVTGLLAAHADVDPVDDRPLDPERARLLALAAELAELPDPPTFVVDSGGGVQVFYCLREQLAAEPEAVAALERLDQRLEAVLGGKSAWNIDRIMRLPDTTNWPNAKKKRVHGRGPSQARLLHESGRVYTMAEIEDVIARLEDEPPAHAEPRPTAEPKRTKPRRPNGHAADDLPPAATPDELRRIFHRHRDQGLHEVWTNPPGETPSDQDYAICCELARLGYGFDSIASLLRSFRAFHEAHTGEHKGKADRPDYIQRTVKRAFEDLGAPPGGSDTAGEQQTAGDARGKNRGTFKAKAKPADDWPEPGAIGEPPAAPAFPTELLPGQLRRWIERQADNMAVPAELLAIPALVCIGGALGKDAVIRPKVNDHSWTERPCLWGALIMERGAGKSPALKEATWPLDRVEAKQRAAYKAEHAAWAERQEGRKAAKKATGIGGGDDPEPKEPQLIIDDASIESAADAMVEARGLVMIKDELSGWVLNMGRYNRGSDRQFWLTCHSGGVGRVNRIQRGRQVIPDTFCGVVGALTPQVARRVLADDQENNPGDGFMERFGLVAYPAPLPWTGLRDVAPERDHRLIVADAVERLSKRPFSREQPLRFDPDAQEAWNAWYDDHMRTRVRGAAAREQPAHGLMTKAAGLALRLCIVIHWFRWTTADGVFEHTAQLVDRRTLGAALGIFERFCVPSYERVLAAFGEVRAHEGALRVLGLIKRKGLTKIMVGDVTKMHWTGLTERKPILAAFEALEDVNILRPGLVPRGGRAPTHWLVNPRL